MWRAAAIVFLPALVMFGLMIFMTALIFATVGPFGFLNNLGELQATGGLV